MLTYSDSIRPDTDALVELFSAVKWESAQYPAQLSAAIGTSETVLTAWEGDRLCGLMTAISDGEMNVFFPYLLLRPDTQGKGVGRTLVTQMLARYQTCYRKVLVCSADKAGFYEKCGLTCMTDQRPMMRIDPFL